MGWPQVPYKFAIYKYVMYIGISTFRKAFSDYLELLVQNVMESIKNQREDYEEEHGSLVGFPIDMPLLPIPQVST